MDETYPIGSDAEMIMRWLLSCTAMVIPDVLARRRRWEGSTSAAVQPTLVMSDTMRALVSDITSRARHTLSSEQLRVFEDSLHASFWVPYVMTVKASELSAVEAQLEQARSEAERWRLEAEASAQRADASTQAAELAAIDAEAARVQTEFLMASTSWRVTAPLRRAAAVLRRSRGG